MDINNNIQINTFSKGMNTDTSDALLDSLEYRYARNVRPICGTEENDNEMHLIEGVELAQYVSQYNKIYAATKIRNRVVIIGSTDGNTWEVDVFKARKNNGTYVPDIVFGPCTEMLTNPEGEGDPALSLVTRYEDEDNIKLYIADGVHNIMVVRLDGATSGLNLIKDISSVVEHSFGGFSDYTEVSGSLKPALVLHAYVLYDKYGASSQLSPLTKPYYITKTENGNTVGYKKDEVSGSGLSFTIHETVGDFDKIKIYRVTYLEYGQQPSIELICDEELGDTDFVFVDSGENPISQLSVAEFTALDNVGIVPREIESKHDYLFASNIKYQIGNNSRAVSKFAKFDFSTETLAMRDNLDMSQDYDRNAWPGFIEDLSDFTKNTSKYVTWLYYLTIGQSGVKSLQRDEIYRYGVMLYDKYGNKWPVKWFADIRTPGIKDNGILETGLWGSYLGKRAINIAVWVNLDKINTGLDGYFTSYEIVRCERTANDKHVLSLGLIGRPLEIYKYTKENPTGYDFFGSTGLQDLPNLHASENLLSTNYICPSGIMTLYNVVSDTTYVVEVKSEYQHPVYSATIEGGYDYTEDRFAKSQSKIVQFASPETCYSDDIYNIFKSRNISILPQCVYKASNMQNGTLISAQVGLMLDLNTPTLTSENIQTYYTYDTNQCGLLLKLGGIYSHLVENSASSTYNILVHPKDIFILSVLFRSTNPWYYPDILSGDFTTTSYDNMYDTHEKFYKNIFNYFDCKLESYNFARQTANIQTVTQINPPELGSFSKERTISLSTNIVPVDTKTFVPWSAPFLYTYPNMSEASGFYQEQTNQDNNDLQYRSLEYPIGMSGKGALLSLDQNGELIIENLANLLKTTQGAVLWRAFGATVVNVVNNSFAPYRGFSDYARQNSTYLQHGVYTNSTDPVVDDGDIYLVDFYYTALHTWYDVNFKYAPVMSTVYKVPVESTINTEIDHGDSYRTNPSLYIQNTPVKIHNYVQDKSLYLYNMAYSSDQTSRFFTGQDSEDLLNNKMDCRVVYSQLKQNNESIDSWLKFKSANYIDVDTRYGEITNLRLFKDTLVFWLKYATGVLSVNERTLIQDVNDTNIILGNGDVLQRYDYISTMYGMTKDQFSDTQSNTTLYWWDSLNKDIVGYSGGQAAMPLTKVKHVYNHITNNTSLEKPSLTYDPKNNEVLFNVVSDGVDSTTGNLIERPLAYNENIQQFTGVYDMPFDYAVSLPDRMFFMKNGKVFHRYDSNSTESNGTLLNPLFPYIKYIVNKDPMYNKTFDIQTFGGRMYGGNDISDLTLRFSTPLKQSSETTGDSITNREYDFRLTIPRNNNSSYGDRMRGKTMQCEIESASNSTDFSLQYITTKYRMSWS